jgi:predicted transposase
MKTIKLPYKTEYDLVPLMRQYSSVVRYAYRRFLKDKTEKEVRNLTKQKDTIKLFEVYPAYSSFIGNMMYDYTDSVNASIEIARRGYEVIIKKNSKKFYPDLVVKSQWYGVADNYTDWKEFFTETKNQGLKYRVLLEDCKHAYSVLQQNSTRKSMVLRYLFYG